jgi:tetratricopeptide (TPR) repeat protein
MALMTFRHSEPPRLMDWPEPDAGQLAAVARKAGAYVSRGQYPQALACYQAALLLDDANAELWFTYATLQRRMGLKNDAAESLEFALRNDSRLYLARYTLANVLLELDRPAAAMEQYREVIFQKPDYTPAWRNLGRLYFALGDLEGARACLEEALERDPQDEQIRILLSRVLRERELEAQN